MVNTGTAKTFQVPLMRYVKDFQLRQPTEEGSSESDASTLSTTGRVRSIVLRVYCPDRVVTVPIMTSEPTVQKRNIVMIKRNAFVIH